LEAWLLSLDYAARS